MTKVKILDILNTRITANIMFSPLKVLNELKARIFFHLYIIRLYAWMSKVLNFQLQFK